MTNLKLYDIIRQDAPSPLCANLFEKLIQTKFRSDPASYKHHHTYKHGLLVHSYELYKELCILVEQNNMNISKETLFLIAFGHDLEKIGSYFYNFSTKQYDYKFHKMFGMSHGEYGFKKLSDHLGEDFKQHPDYELIQVCIYGHMGDYARSKREKQYYHNHVDGCPLLWLTHQADMKSCELNGKDYVGLLEESNV